jgi:hypothetical protein
VLRRFAQGVLPLPPNQLGQHFRSLHFDLDELEHGVVPVDFVHSYRLSHIISESEGCATLATNYALQVATTLL